MPSSIIQPVVNCVSAEELLNAILPIGPNFRDEPPDTPWLFRGQGKDYPLVPSAFRKDGKLARLAGREITNYSDLLLAERDVLVKFFELADRRGLVLPDDSQHLRSLLETLRSQRGDQFTKEGYEEWIAADSALSLAALAQHYGVPTRLLDWSRSVLFAAFFAAEGALREMGKGADPTESIVVWSLYFPKFGRHDDIANAAPVKIVTAPSASNPNLKAQQGIFTLARPPFTREAAQGYLPLDRMLEELAAQYGQSKSDIGQLVAGCRMRKFTTPLSEAKKLLYFLAKLDVTPSAVYPGYHSIVRDLEMMALWP